MVKLLLIIGIVFFIGCSSSEQLTKEIPIAKTESEPVVVPKAPEVVLPEYWDVGVLNDFIIAENQRITNCYENVKVKNPSLSGSMVIRAKFNPRGTIDSFLVVSDDLKNNDLKNCIRKLVMGWKTPKVDTVKNQSVWLEIPYDFTDFSGKSSDLRGENEIVTYAASKKADLFRCVSADENTVEITIIFFILPNGKVENVKIKESNIVDEEIVSCVLKQVSIWTFRSIQTEKKQQITLPFVFSK